MIVAGLTGSIGMGKSTVLAMFAEAGAAVWNADEAVHRLYETGGAAVPMVAAEFPDAVRNGVVDRARLSASVLNDPARLRALEAIVHPLVALDRSDFLNAAQASGAGVAVLDIPLLYENGYEAGFDAVIVVSAPVEAQRARVLARDGMTEEKFEKILAQQTPDAEKRARCDYLILTDKSLDATRTEVETVLADMKTRFAKRPEEA